MCGVPPELVIGIIPGLGHHGYCPVRGGGRSGMVGAHDKRSGTGDARVTRVADPVSGCRLLQSVPSALSAFYVRPSAARDYERGTMIAICPGCGAGGCAVAAFAIELGAVIA